MPTKAADAMELIAYTATMEKIRQAIAAYDAAAMQR